MSLKIFHSFPKVIQNIVRGYTGYGDKKMLAITESASINSRFYLFIAEKKSKTALSRYKKYVKDHVSLFIATQFESPMVTRYFLNILIQNICIRARSVLNIIKEKEILERLYETHMRTIGIIKSHNKK